MALPESHQCRTCSPPPGGGATLHEDLVVGAPLSMDDLDKSELLERFAGKYIHDGCQVIEVHKVAADSLSGHAWVVQFLEGDNGQR